MRGDECQRQSKLVPSMRNKPMHNARNMRKVKTLKEHILKVKGVKLQMQNDIRLSNDENKDEGLYNELKAWCYGEKFLWLGVPQQTARLQKSIFPNMQ